MPASGTIEVEWQFGVDDLAAAERVLRARAAALGLTLTPATTRVLFDEYLDTQDWAFHRASFALRLRETDGAVEATLKGFGDQSDGPYRRREINEPLDAAGMAELLAATGPVARRVRAVVGPGELRGLFSLRTERSTFDVHANGTGRPVAEVALDVTEVANAGDTPLALSRIEIELSDPGALASVEQLATALGRVEGFERASSSKFAIGLEATGQSPVEPPDLGPTRITPASTLGEVAYAALRRQFARFLANEPGTRLGEDIEALHDMRVATRRLRTALAVFRAALPPQLEALRPELGWVADALGEVRDLDVQIEWLSEEEAALPEPGEDSALAPLIDVLGVRREEARSHMLGALDSPRFAALVEGATVMLREGTTTVAGDASAVDAAPALLRKRWRRYRRLAERLDADASEDAYHDTRIRAKRIRYAAEFTAGLYGDATADFAAALKRAQNELGRYQDAAVAVDLLERTAAVQPLPRHTVFAMGRLAERQREVVRSVAQQFPRTHQRLRLEWRRLRGVLEAGERAG
ncbi:MAG: CHAD domain-containing protein [Chloroflexi bacterium]|nr:CHAD domain-containing protein [Chloroflexota bacterium]